jgi:hypothetical protein
LSTIIASRHPKLIKKLVLVCPAGTTVWRPNDSIYVQIIQSAHALLSSSVGVPVVRLAITLGDWISTTHLRLTTNKRNLSYNSLANIPKTLTTEKDIMGKPLAPMETKRPQQSERFLKMIDMTVKGIVFQAKLNPFIAEVRETDQSCTYILGGVYITNYLSSCPSSPRLCMYRLCRRL